MDLIRRKIRLTVNQITGRRLRDLPMTLDRIVGIR